MNTTMLEEIVSAPKVAARTPNSAVKPVPLYQSAKGDWVKIHSVPAGLIRAQFLRFGINEGERVLCIERLPGGTVVIKKNRQQIAIGHTLAKQILVVILKHEE